MDNDLARQLKATALSKPTLVQKSPPKPPPLRAEAIPEHRPGTGGLPYEPLPELEAEQKYLRFRSAKYQSTPYKERAEEEREEVVEEKPEEEKRIPLLICKDLQEYYLKGVQKPMLFENPTMIVDIIKSYPELGFLYLKRCSSEEDRKYNPYRFIVCSYFDVEESHFCTISPLGFAEFSATGCEYTPLEIFRRDYVIHQQMLQMELFSKYYVWKYFSLWYAKNRQAKWIEALEALCTGKWFERHNKIEWDIDEHVEPDISPPEVSEEEDDEDNEELP